MSHPASPPDTNNGPPFLISSGVLLVVGLALCSARIYTRFRHFRLDDYLIALATLLAFASFFVSIVAVTHGWGHLSPYVSLANKVIAFKCLFVNQVFWILATALVRVSIAVSLLRLSESNLWRYSLRFMILVQITIYTGFMIFLLFDCWPIESNWKTVPGVKCWKRHHYVTFGWVSNVLMVIMDVFLALMPIRLVRILQRPLREKILVCCLMATGLVCAGIASYKMTLSEEVFKGDTLSTTVRLSLWNRIEELVGIIAACMPCLKQPAQRILRRVGVLTNDFGLSVPSCVVSLREVACPHCLRSGDSCICSTRNMESVYSGENSVTHIDNDKTAVDSTRTASKSTVSRVEVSSDFP